MLHLLQKPLEAARPTRRTFLKISAGSIGGLVLAMNLPRSTAAAAEGEFIQPFVHIRPDNTVVVLSKHLDKGQGTASGLATLVADELDAAWDQVRVEFAPSDPQVYANSLFGVQGTGGSTAIANSFMQYRAAAAAEHTIDDAEDVWEDDATGETPTAAAKPAAKKAPAKSSGTSKASGSSGSSSTKK